MSYAEWTDELSVGIAKIDEEHKNWLVILNELHDLLKGSANEEIMRNIIERMLEYTVIHFTHEEMYMINIKYPLFESHKEKHQTLIHKIELLQSRLSNERNFRLTVDTLLILKNWLVNHIMVTDKKLGEYTTKLQDANAE